MSARAELEARARAGFRAVMLSNHTAEKFASESSAGELRFLCSVFDEECSWREKSKRERLLKRARFPVPKTFDGYDCSRIRLPEGMPRNDVESCAFVGSMQNLVLTSMYFCPIAPIIFAPSRQLTMSSRTNANCPILAILLSSSFPSARP